MKKQILIGESDFKNIIKEEGYYIDKTLIIKEIIQDGAKIILFPRPRRFGKTLNLTTLKYFFSLEEAEENQKLFSDLKISKEKEFEKQGKYPVIYLTFKDVKKSKWNECLEYIKGIILNLYNEFSYLLNSNKLTQSEKNKINKILNECGNISDYETAIKNLSEYLYKHYNQQVVILIDEYDVPIQEGYLNGYYKEVIELMRNLLSGAYKYNKYLYKGVLTGILRVAKESIFSGLNNLEVYTILSKKYAEFFGFTEAEVKQMLSEYDLSEKFKDIQNWYDGYIFGGKTIYNPWSIIKYIKNEEHKFEPYWINTSSNDLIGDLLLNTANEEIKDKLYSLLKGESIETKLESNVVFEDLRYNPESIYIFLFFSGYLKYVEEIGSDAEVRYRLKLVNKEIEICFEDLIRRWFNKISGSISTKNMLEELINGRIENFINEFKIYILNAFSYFITGKKNSQERELIEEEIEREKEKVYQAFLLGMFAMLSDRYNIRAEREFGYGKVDIAIFHKSDKSKPAIIMELKVKQKNKRIEKILKDAMKQIEKKKYDVELRSQGYNKIIKMVIVFDGKQVHFDFSKFRNYKKSK